MSFETESQVKICSLHFEVGWMGNKTGCYNKRIMVLCCVVLNDVFLYFSSQQSQKVSILPSITEGAQQRGTKQQRETRKSFVCSVLLAASGVQNELVTEDDSPQRSCSPVDVGQDAVREDACSLDEDGVVPESSELSLNEQIDRLTGVVDHSIESITLLAASITSTVSQLQEKL